MRDLIIFGNGQIAEVAHYYFTKDANRTVKAFTVNSDFIEKESIFDTPVVPFETLPKYFPSENYEIYVAMSSKKVNKLRMQKVAEVEARGYKLSSFIHSRSEVWAGFKLQPNTFIMENNVIQPFTTIGKNVTLWSGNHIGHHTHVKDHCFIASHVVVSGSVNIGEGCFIGVNATLRDNISLGSHVVVGASCVLLSDAPDNSVFIGKRSEMSRIPSYRLRSI